MTDSLLRLNITSVYILLIQVVFVFTHSIIRMYLLWLCLKWTSVCYWMFSLLSIKLTWFFNVTHFYAFILCKTFLLCFQFIKIHLSSVSVLLETLRLHPPSKGTTYTPIHTTVVFWTSHPLFASPLYKVDRSCEDLYPFSLKIIGDVRHWRGWGSMGLNQCSSLSKLL